MEKKEIRRVREIRVFDLFISVCQRWRSLLICLLIGAILFGAYGWYKSAFPAKTKRAAEISWEEDLTEVERWEAEQVSASVDEYNRLLAEMDSVTDYALRVDYLQKIADIQNMISMIRARFSSEQDAYYEYLRSGGAVDDAVVLKPRHISMKYIVVGAFLGLILAALVIVIKYIAKATIKAASESEDTLNLPVFGRFDGSNSFYAKRHTALDRKLRRIKQKNKQRLSYEETTELTAARLQMAAKNLDLKQVCLLVDSNVNLDMVRKKEFLSDIQEKTGAAPKVMILKNLLSRPEAMLELSENDRALLVIQTETSRYNDIWYEIFTCESNGVGVLGTLIVE